MTNRKRDPISTGPRSVRRPQDTCLTPASHRSPPLSRRRFLRAGVGALAWAGVLASRRAGANSDSTRPMPKAAYLSYYGVGDSTIRSRVFELLDSTELNAVVIDVKGDRGYIPYASEVPLAREAGAMGPVRLPDFDEVLGRLKAEGIYTIARVVAFKDHVVARHRPGWAVADRRTGRPWIDAERLAWLDPFKSEAWSYPIAVAAEAARKGFDEIQFDYLRFPTDGKLSAAQYSTVSTEQTRIEAITGFLTQARAALAPFGARLALDVFGYVVFNLDDTGIGQHVEMLAPLIDVLCPMAYPSAYQFGIPGQRNPLVNPYAIVLETVRRARERLAPHPVAVRPWIQDFRDYAFDRRPFGVEQVRAQMKAALDAGSTGWMLWNPQNRYTAEALAGKTRPAP